MKRFILAGLFICITSFCYSQLTADSKRDYQWCFGIKNVNFFLGRSVLSFINSPPDTISYNSSINLRESNTSMSDSLGNLLFYSNYFKIIDKSHQVMLNGDSLNCCTTFFNDYNSLGEPGRIPQLVLSLPKPKSPNIYYIFHTPEEWGPPNGIHAIALWYSIIDMNGNNGLGAVIQKNISLLSDTLSIGYLTVCRHANGRDWWLPVREFNSNRFHLYLITPDGIEDKGVQDAGGPKILDMLGQSVFSPNGEKFIVGGTLTMDTAHISLYDFDRCTGLLKWDKYIKYSGMYNMSIGYAFSPDSRLLYYTNDSALYQLDTQAPDIENSRVTIGVIDGFMDSAFANPSLIYFKTMQLGPDNKLYISGGNTHYLHVVEYPDSLGVACGLNQHSLRLPKLSAGSMPHFPNYRLGPLIGSGCDTLTSVGITPLPFGSAQGAVYPNPARDRLTITIPSPETVQFTLMDIQGREVLRAYVRDKDSIPLGDLPPALYIYKIETNKGSEYGKLVLE